MLVITTWKAKAWSYSRKLEQRSLYAPFFVPRSIIWVKIQLIWAIHQDCTFAIKSRALNICLLLDADPSWATHTRTPVSTWERTMHITLAATWRSKYRANTRVEGSISHWLLHGEGSQVSQLQLSPLAPRCCQGISSSSCFQTGWEGMKGVGWH